MENFELIKSENFGEIEVDLYQNYSKEIFMTREQIGKALEYKNPMKSIAKIHERNLNRLEKYSFVKMTNGRKIYYYSVKGIYEICRLSRQSKADKFMDWVWDVVEDIRTKGYYRLANQNENIEINPDNLNKAYEQLTFIASIMNEAGVSGKVKLQAIKNIYGAMGINLFEQKIRNKVKLILRWMN